MSKLLSLLEHALDGKALDWLGGAAAELDADAKALPQIFPQLPRRLGRQALGSSEISDSVQGGGRRRLDLGSWRRCDAGALDLLIRCGGADLQGLYQHGDMEERTMVLRCLAMLPLSEATVELFGEIQRSNTQSHFEAGALDSNLLVSALQEPNCSFDQADFNRMMVKLAFCDLAVERVYDAAQGADADLSRMLQDLASEREAAGRSIWAGTAWMIAHAPIDGSIARILGGIEHGDNRQRMAAILGLAQVYRPEFASYVSERLQHEPRSELRSLLEQLLARA